MIKLSGKTGLGEPLLLLGLSGENVTRLVAGEPKDQRPCPSGSSGRMYLRSADCSPYRIVTPARW